MMYQYVSYQQAGEVMPEANCRAATFVPTWYHDQIAEVYDRVRVQYEYLSTRMVAMACMYTSQAFKYRMDKTSQHRFSRIMPFDMLPHLKTTNKILKSVVPTARSLNCSKRST